MTKIKICGITNKTDAFSAVKLSVDMLGFVFYKKSKRYVEPRIAEYIIDELPEQIAKVGVFVDEPADALRAMAEGAGLDTVQLHGNETPEYCAGLRRDYKVIKAFRLKSREDLRKINDYDVDYYLLDTCRPDAAGGTGETFDWNILKDFELLKPVILSGGLKAQNVGRAIAEVVPYGVDVSSGVEESPGKKDIALMKKFVEEVRRAE